MTNFRILLAAIFLTVSAYTLVTISNHGMDFLPIFFGDMMEMTWRGQFNLDFMGFLILSGVWTAWRNQFSPAGLLLGVVAFNFGAPFLSLYLLYLSFQTGGDIKAMMLGPNRA